MSIAERLFAAGEETDAEAERELKTLLRAVQYDRLGWDDYDLSLEIHGVPPDHRLAPEIVQPLYDAGFLTVFVNHTDKWETHYNDGREPWRVSYPDKRGDDGGSIWVEAIVETWPKDWFDGGYAVVKQ